jgi:hypothetical protein
MDALVPASKVGSLTSQTAPPYVANPTILSNNLGPIIDTIVQEKIAIANAAAITNALSTTFFPMSIQVPTRVVDTVGTFVYSNAVAAYLAAQVGGSSVVNLNVIRSATTGMATISFSVVPNSGTTLSSATALLSSKLQNLAFPTSTGGTVQLWVEGETVPTVYQPFYFEAVIKNDDLYAALPLSQSDAATFDTDMHTYLTTQVGAAAEDNLNCMASVSQMWILIFPFDDCPLATRINFGLFDAIRFRLTAGPLVVKLLPGTLCICSSLFHRQLPL